MSEEDRLRFEAEVVRGKIKKSGFVKHAVIYLVITALLAAMGYAEWSRVPAHIPYSEESEYPEVDGMEEKETFPGEEHHDAHSGQEIL